ncbi:MAG: branched-chain amino acid ABC transporter permease [Chloroflexi bacterium]|nr:branched-chain amino acid ABC transporter permease [Chloroflexota bacterium]
MTPTILGQALVSGLLIGGIYALVAAGLTLIFGVMKIVNFAQGNLLTLGMYASFWLFTLYGIDPYLSILIVGPLMFGVGFLMQKIAIEPVLGEPDHNQLLLTLGIGLLIQNGILALWGASFRNATLWYSNVIYLVGDVAISLPKVIAFVGALLMLGLLYLLLEKTDLGRAMRAAAEETEGSLLVGVNVRNIYALAFGIGAACAGVAGALILPFFYVSPDVGDLFILTAFIVVVLGGMGSMAGSLVGGLMVGIAESIGAVVMPGSMKQVLLFGIFILVLLLRPTGLFGSKA